MRKGVIFTVLLSVLFTSCISATQVKQIYANTKDLNDFKEVYKLEKDVASIEQAQKDMLKKNVNSIEIVSKNIDLIARSALDIKANEKEKLDENINRIDYLVSQINSLAKDIQSDYQSNVKNIDVANYLLSMSAILSNYKFALSQLKLHLQTSDADIAYKSLGLFYIIMNDANVQLNTIKSELKS